MSTDQGVIHDLGYRRYDGARRGRTAIVAALAWHSLRTTFGLGRGARAKLVPFAMLVLLCLPALLNAVLVARSPGHVRQIGYDSYVFRLRALVMLIFVAAQAPELVSRNLRHRVLPLYLSRPLHRLDYPLAKYAAFTAGCLIVTGVPLLLLYLGTVASASGDGQIWAETQGLAGGLLVAVAWSLLLAAIGLALAALTSRRAYATGMVASYLVVTWTLASLFAGGGQASGLLSPFTVLEGVRTWLGGSPSGPVPSPGGLGAAYGAMLLLLLAASLGGLAVRYRKAGEA